jgi:hypothetical protein
MMSEVNAKAAIFKEGICNSNLFTMFTFRP